MNKPYLCVFVNCKSCYVSFSHQSVSNSPRGGAIYPLALPRFEPFDPLPSKSISGSGETRKIVNQLCDFHGVPITYTMQFIIKTFINEHQKSILIYAIWPEQTILDFSRGPNNIKGWIRDTQQF